MRKLHRFFLDVFPHIPERCISSDVEKVFEVMRSNRLLTYMNYFPLEEIIKRFGDSDMTSKMEIYKEHLKAFKLTIKIKEYVPEYRSEFGYDHDMFASEIRPNTAPDYLDRLTIKLEEHVGELHLDYIDELWTSVSCILSLPPLALLLDTVVMNSILVVWLIPSNLVPKAIEKAQQSAGFFRKHPILKVTIGKDCVYTAESGLKQEDPLTRVGEEGSGEVCCKHKELGCSWEGGNVWDLEQHLKDECEFAEVVCEFKAVGCSASPLRRDLAKHGETCTGEHLQLMCQAFVSMRVEFEEKIREQRAMFEHKLREREKEAERQVAGIRHQITRLFDRTDSHGEELLEQKRASKSATLLSFERLVYPPLEFTMTDFQKHYTEDLDWDSPEFYSHSSGYKLKMKVYANREVLGGGMNMSVYFYVLRGEYNGHLKWPRKISIAVQLFNHITGEWGSQRVTENTWNNPASFHQSGMGWPEFITHSALKYSDKTQYLKDDAITFRVASVRLA